jgi:hypothetical protein
MFRTPPDSLVLATLLSLAAVVLLACGHAKIAFVAGLCGFALASLHVFTLLQRRRRDKLP